MRKSDFSPYVQAFIDSDGNEIGEFPLDHNTRVVAWQMGFEPFAIAVCAYDAVSLSELTADDVEEIAQDYCRDHWGIDCSFSDSPADYLL